MTPTRTYTTWYKCLFCTRVYPLAHQLVEHRNILHPEQWKKKKLERALKKLQAAGFNGETLENECNNNTEHMSDITDSSNEYETGNSDTASNSTVVVNESECESDSNDVTQENEKDDNLDNSMEDDSSVRSDCKITYKNPVKKEMELKLNKCDQLVGMIKIKQESDLLEKSDSPDNSDEEEDTTEDAPMLDSPMKSVIPKTMPDSSKKSVMLKRARISNSPKKSVTLNNSNEIGKEKVFRLYRCDHCSKQFLHKWGLDFHRNNVHVKKKMKSHSKLTI